MWRSIRIGLLFCISLTWQAARSSPAPEAWWYGDFPVAEVKHGSRMIDGSGEYRVYQNFWFHAQRFYAVNCLSTKEANATAIKADMSLNMMLIEMPVAKAEDFYQHVQTGWWGGNTLLIDFPFPAFPENMGHWAEVLLPLYSALVAGTWRQHVQGSSHHVDRLLLSNVRREQLQAFEWLQAMLRISLAPALPEGTPLPQIICYDELETMDTMMWLGMQNLIIVNDRYTHPKGRGGFASVEHGQQFREAAYKEAGLTRPSPWALGGAPRTITLLSAVLGEMVMNRDELLNSLEDIAEAFDMRVRPYSATSAAGFASYVSAMSKTGVLVARHGPMLANALFLPPGAVVLELLPYNWEWKGISQVYHNVTTSVGDVHHFAWRAKHPRWAQYMDQDEARYAHWTAEECSSRHCVEVHARAGMLADTSTIHEMLMDVLPAAFRGAAVSDLKQPWPLAFTATGTTGLWWDK
ncbi:hypothetical protein ABBQ38_003301 [Trebouxia sp. C0009 RCD-2024]